MLSHFFRGKNYPLLPGDKAYPGDEKLSRHDQGDKPDGKKAGAEKSDKGNGDEEFVGEGIEETTKVGLNFPEAGEVAVEPIGESRSHKKSQSKPCRPKRDRGMGTGLQKNEEDKGRHDACHREPIGESHTRSFKWKRR